MVRLINYLLIAFLLTMPLYNKLDGGLLALVVISAILLVVIWLLDAMTFDDNLGVLSFMICLPYVLYLGDLPIGLTSVWAFLGTIFLSVSFPFVFWFLFLQLTEPLKGEA